MDQTGSSSTNGIASQPAVRLVFLAIGIIVFLLVAWVGRVIVMLLLGAVVFAVLLSAVVHHCIQGWSGIAKWGGIPMKTLIELVRPKPEAKTAAFLSFGEALYGGLITIPRASRTY